LNRKKFRQHLLHVVLVFLAVTAIDFDVTAQRRKIDSLKNLLGKTKDTSRIRILNELSWYYKNINVDTAVNYARKALSLSREGGYKKLMADSYNTLGSARQAADEYDSALLLLQLSIQAKSEIGDSVSTAGVLNNIGIIYDEKGDYDKALDAYFKGLRIAERTGKEAMQANILSNIGVVYKKQKQYDKVLEYYNTALVLYKKLNSTFGITVTSGNIGSVLIQTREYEKSIAYSQAAKKGYDDLGYVRYVPYTLGNIAIAYDSLHLRKLAEEYYITAFNQHVKFGNHYEAAYNAKNLVFFYLKNHEMQQASNYASQAIALAKQIGAKEMLRDSYHGMSGIYAGMGKFREAYSYHTKYAALKDSLFEEGRTKTVFELQVKYESELKERKLSEQKALLAINELQLQESNNRVLILATSSIFLVIAGILFYQNQKARRRKLEQEAQFKLQLAEIKLENEIQQDRLRISRELHDNIGSRLLFLYTATDNLTENPSSGTRDKIEQLSVFTKNTLHELRRTVWFINKKSVSLDELQSKLTEYFNFLNQSAQLTIHVRLEADPSLMLRSARAEATFRIAQEAVSNSIKHAQATHIDIRLNSLADGSLQLQITDDGQGFDSNKTHYGNGVKNMNVHSSNAGGKIDIVSASAGTTINFILPFE
jgi:signal transduction histidine kinase